MKCISEIMFLMCFLQTDAQISFPFTKSFKHLTAKGLAYSREGWRGGINLLSLAEPQTAFSLSAEYRFRNNLSVWTELSYIFNDAYISNNWSALRGFRCIIQPHYFCTPSRQFFIAPELRVKNFKYNTTAIFINSANPDTLFNLTTRVRHHTIGGAIVIGRQIQIDGHFMLELSGGLGVRKRKVIYNAPENYSVEIPETRFGLSPKYPQSLSLPYFPVGVRFVWCFD